MTKYVIFTNTSSCDRRLIIKNLDDKPFTDKYEVLDYANKITNCSVYILTLSDEIMSREQFSKKVRGEL